MTVIEIRPHRWGWKVFEAPGVEPVFPEKRQAISYAQERACFRSADSTDSFLIVRSAIDPSMPPQPFCQLTPARILPSVVLFSRTLALCGRPSFPAAAFTER